MRFSTKCADQDRLYQLVRSNRADRRIIATAIDLPDHRLTSLKRVVDPDREIALRRTCDQGPQGDISHLDRDRLPVTDRRPSTDPESTRRNVKNWLPADLPVPTNADPILALQPLGLSLAGLFDTDEASQRQDQNVVPAPK